MAKSGVALKGTTTVCRHGLGQSLGNGAVTAGAVRPREALAWLTGRRLQQSLRLRPTPLLA
jgi:hypothetical protein